MKMERVWLLMFLPALLSAEGSFNSTTNSSTSPTSIQPPTSKPAFIETSSLQKLIGRLRVRWVKSSPCQGFIAVYMNLSDSSKNLCYKESFKKSTAMRQMCEDGGCGKFIGVDFKEKDEGYLIHDNWTVSTEQCERAYIKCQVKYDKELVAYKVVTGVLLSVVLAVVLLRFARPVYEAVLKRYSPNRQNRWIGPTQSQSVSYHRGQQSGPNNNTVKRSSYPGLDRLSVNPSREPSSNRNSDYDSFGYN